MPPKANTALPMDTMLLKPGLRLAVGLSGGADSVALLRSLAERREELGLVLHAVHLHHGLRGAEADRDLEFCRALAERLSVPFHEARVDVAAGAKGNAEKRNESTEEAARRLRYAWFLQLMADGTVDAVATAHTLDDQAETVLAKFLRGAWTEGLSGIHPEVTYPEGRILRPFLAVSRRQIEGYLRALAQPWREDSSNRELAFTRNRIRHELLPLLEGWNPRLRGHLSQMAELAREEEAWLQAEAAQWAAKMILPGTPVRGGGRAAGGGVAVEIAQLAQLPVAMQRRVLRHAAKGLGQALDFAATEALRALALAGHAGQKRELPQGLRAERTHRELRLTLQAVGGSTDEAPVEYRMDIPGEVVAEAFGLRVKIAKAGAINESESPARTIAILRNWRPGDRVQLRHSSAPRKVKEILERMKISGSERSLWPVIELNGRIVWMRGAEVEPEPGIAITTTDLLSETVP